MSGDGVARGRRAQDQDQIAPSPEPDSPIENYADVLEFLRGAVRTRSEENVDNKRIDAEFNTDTGVSDSCGVFSDVDSDDIRAADEYERTKRDIQMLEKRGLRVVFVSPETMDRLVSKD